MIIKKVYNSFLSRFSRSSNRQSGIILIIVLWVLVILSMLAMGLGRRTGIEFELMKYSMSQSKLKQIAMAGVRYATHLIHERSKQRAAIDRDTKYQCGFVLQEGQRSEEIFKDVLLGEGAFTISFVVEGDGAVLERYGFTDEESRIDINALGQVNYEVFQYLLEHFGVSEDLSKQIASSLIDWRDENQEVFNSPYGAEDDYYASLGRPYRCKNGPFNSLEELMLVRGMTAEIFEKIKPYITIFTDQGKLVLNFDTAPLPCLKALARYCAGPKTNTELSDADSLVEKVIEFRNGADELWATEDDLPVNIHEMALNAKERVIAFLMENSRSSQSKSFRVKVNAVDATNRFSSQITAVIRAQDGKIAYWRRQ